MTDHLIEESPLVILPTLAAAVGLNESIFIQQVHYWTKDRKGGIEHEGYRWTWDTYQQWLEQFPFWSRSTLKRVIKSCRDKGLIVSKKIRRGKCDHTNFYRVDREKLAEIIKDFEHEKDQKTRLGQNEPIDEKQAIRLGQNEPITIGSKWTNHDGVKMNQSLTNTSTNTSSDNSPKGEKTDSAKCDSGEKAEPTLRAPAELNKEAFAEYSEYRKSTAKLKRSWSPQAAQKAINLLAKYSPEEQQAMVDKTVLNGWTGLFPEKQPVALNNAAQNQAEDRSANMDEVRQILAKRAEQRAEFGF